MSCMMWTGYSRICVAAGKHVGAAQVSNGNTMKLIKDLGPLVDGKFPDIVEVPAEFWYCPNCKCSWLGEIGSVEATTGVWPCSGKIAAEEDLEDDRPGTLGALGLVAAIMGSQK